MSAPIRTLAAFETELLVRDPFTTVAVLAMPLFGLGFLSHGIVGGPAVSVPGLAVLTGFMAVPLVAIAFYREHGWNTWDRLRSLAVRPAAVAAGKLIPLACLLLVQQVLVLGAGALLFGMPLDGPVGLVPFLVFALVACELAFGLVLMAYARSMAQVHVCTTLATFSLAGVGGAITPLELLPAWVGTIAPVSPLYWAASGLREIASRGGSPARVLQAIGVLSAVAIVLAVLALRRFDRLEEKVYV